MHRSILLATVIALTTAVTPVAALEVKLGHHVETNTPLHEQALMFKEEIERRLPDVKITVFPGGQLGKEAAQIDAIRLGAQDMAVIASGAMKIDGKVGVFDLPWLFQNREHVVRAMSGPLGARVEAQLEKAGGFEVLGMYENGFRHVLNKVRPVSTPQDLQGLKIRITGGKFRQDVFASMGANPAPVAWTEVFSALQTGVVDGAEAATYGFNAAKLYELAKYMSLTHHVYSPTFLIASRSFMNRLTDEQRRVFLEVGAAITERAYAAAEALEVRALEHMKGEGVQVNEVDFVAFQQATRSVYGTYTERHGDDWIKLIAAARKAP